MREIKFKAWNKKVKVMSVEVDLFHGLEEWERNDTEVMQYTGFKDRHGKEIYEGDIVKILHGGWMSQHLGDEKQKDMTHEQYLDSLTKQYEVVFILGSFMGKRHIGYNPWETDQEGYTYTRLTPDKHGYIEIIGNIYESELLPTKPQE